MRRKQKKQVRQYQTSKDELAEVIDLYKQEYEAGNIKHLEVANVFRASGLVYVLTITRANDKINVYPLHDLQLVKRLLETLGVIYYVDENRNIEQGSDVGEGIYENRD